MSPLSRLLSVTAAATVAVVAIACTAEPGTENTPPVVLHSQAGATIRTSDQIAQLRAAIAPYRRLEAAKQAGWKDQITTCWYHGGMGAMGYHFAEAARLDGTIDQLKPEALVYEPMKSGEYKLGAVEYIVPIAKWTGAKPPRLYDREFDRNDALGLYVMHVWLFSENPAGIFAAWNPKVSCQFAAESEDRGPAH